MSGGRGWMKAPSRPRDELPGMQGDCGGNFRGGRAAREMEGAPAVEMGGSKAERSEGLFHDVTM
jgi:hypothetical protein